MIGLMEQLLDNDNLQLSRFGNTPMPICSHQQRLLHLANQQELLSLHLRYPDGGYRFLYVSRGHSPQQPAEYVTDGLAIRLSTSSVNQLDRKDAYLKSISVDRRAERTEHPIDLREDQLRRRANHRARQSVAHHGVGRTSQSRSPMGYTPPSTPKNPIPQRLFRAMSTS